MLQVQQQPLWPRDQQGLTKSVQRKIPANFYLKRANDAQVLLFSSSSFLDSSDGSLKASTHHGTIDVYVSQLRKVDLKSQKGSITVKVPASLKAYLQLSGRKVDVSSEIQLKETQSASKEDHVTLSGHMNQRNETDKWIKADTQNGKVYLKSQSWIQSVKLKSS
ncbi:protein hypothetical protein [Limosa lapponica baueri]|uniref:DUF7330 domain-containing protein n=1 Tax=Limosa lapponica baueri TaxID=1758121 RepID=A0A2I0TIX1_LIMLA|nr:protein hypothetical protein [Limosa lapponica baueri]